MNNINTVKKIKLLDGNTVEIDFSKIQVVSTKMEDRHKFTFPEEGYFVGATNAGGLGGRDYFDVSHLYSPGWCGDKQKWGGYLASFNEVYRPWWTYNYVSSNICTDYLYLCDDYETAKKLASLLNSFPSRNIKMIESDIKSICSEIKKLMETIDFLKNINRNYSQLLTTAI